MSPPRAVEIGFAGEFFHESEGQCEQCHCAQGLCLDERVIRQPRRGCLVEVGGFFPGEE